MCRLYATRMPPHHAFSHLTAAQLYGLPLPPSLASLLPLHVTAAAPARAPQGSRVVGHQTRLSHSDVRVVEGVPVVQPERALVELGRYLSVEDLVAVGDFLVTGDPVLRARPLSSLGRVEAAVRAAHRVRGRRALMAAVPLMRVGAFSRPETLVRLAAVHFGLPEPVLNRPVRDNGAYLGRPDISWPDYRVGIEYEGDHHRVDRATFQRDIVRFERFSDADWRLFRATSRDLLALDVLMTRVKRCIRARGWTP